MGWGPIDDNQALAGLELAYTLGARLFDTADVYGHGRSERLLGRLVEQVPRDSLVLSSKVGYFRGTAPHGYQPLHMRHQLERSLDNLRTDYLDIYFFHHAEFGDNDEMLDAAIETMWEFRAQGLVRAVGMRGLHRFALDRLSSTRSRTDKVARFRTPFDRIQPRVLAVRDNLLTPQARSEGIFAFAAAHHCGVLINKPLAQGLLTALMTRRHPRLSARKTTGAGTLVHPRGTAYPRRRAERTPPACRRHDPGVGADRAVVLPPTLRTRRRPGWLYHPRPDQTNLTCLGQIPTDEQLSAAREIMAHVQSQLDASGEVFVDEHPAEGTS